MNFSHGFFGQSVMKRHCEEGKILCDQFEEGLKDWVTISSFDF